MYTDERALYHSPCRYLVRADRFSPDPHDLRDRPLHVVLNLHRLCTSQTYQRRTIPSLEVQSRGLGILCEYFRDPVPLLGLCVSVLPICATSDTGNNELGHLDLRCSRIVCAWILPREGQARVPRTCALRALADATRCCRLDAFAMGERYRFKPSDHISWLLDTWLFTSIVCRNLTFHLSLTNNFVARPRMQT